MAKDVRLRVKARAPVVVVVDVVVVGWDPEKAR
jgi:hypothetical protein